MAIKIKPSGRNTNRHTDAGMELLSKSVEKVGAIESISVTEEGTIYPELDLSYIENEFDNI
jgi:hypothetical protein